MVAAGHSWLFWVAIAAFCCSVAWAAIGNLVLFLVMMSRGSRLPFLFGGLALLLYFREAPPVRSKGLDAYARSIVASVGVAIILIVALGPFL